MAYDKQTVYNASGVYKEAGGGGNHPLLVFGESDRSGKSDGWIFGNNCVKTGGGGAKYGISTTIASYNTCPYINNAKKIEFAFKCLWSDTIGYNYRFYRGNLDVGFQLFVANIGTSNQLSFFLCANDSGSAVKTYSNILTISLNTDYEFKNILDVENGKLYLYVNDNLIINDSVNISDLKLSRWVPCIGLLVDTTECTLPNGFILYRDSFTYKIDDVEQIPQETLE